jgi:hypothetical protein
MKQQEIDPSIDSDMVAARYRNSVPRAERAGIRLGSLQRPATPRV